MPFLKIQNNTYKLIMNNTLLILFSIFSIFCFGQEKVKYFEGSNQLSEDDFVNYNRKEIVPENNSKPYHKVTFNEQGKIILIEGFLNNLNYPLIRNDYESYGFSPVKCVFLYQKEKTEIQFFNGQNKRVEATFDFAGSSDKIIIYRSKNNDTLLLSYVDRKSFVFHPSEYYNFPIYRQLQPDVISRSVRYVYRNNKLIKKSYLYLNAQLINNDSGYAETSYRYDELGRQTEQIITDELGNLANGYYVDVDYVYAIEQIKYNGPDLQSILFLSENGDKYELKYQYLNSDTIVFQTWYDKNDTRIGKPNSGIGEIKSTFKKGENITAYYDLNGNPENYISYTVITCECASKIERKLKDGTTEEIFFDTIGKQIKRRITPLISIETFNKYDKNGNIIEEKYLDSLGNPSPIYGNSYKTIYKRNPSGLILQELKYGINDDLIGNSLLKEYDSIGRVLSISYLDNSEKAGIDGFSVARYTYKYDQNGNVSEYGMYGEDGLLIGNNSKLGFAFVKLKYDKYDNLIECSKFDSLYAENPLLAIPLEIMKIKYNYVDSSYSTEKYDSDSTLIEIDISNKNGDCMQYYRYNESCSKLLEMTNVKFGQDAKSLETWFFNYELKNKKCLLKSYRVHREATFDIIYINQKKKPINNVNGYHRHDTNSQKYFNTRGEEVFYNVETLKYE